MSRGIAPGRLDSSIPVSSWLVCPGGTESQRPSRFVRLSCSHAREKNRFFSSTPRRALAGDVNFETAGENQMADRAVKRMVRPERFELPTPCFVGKGSIQLSYGRRQERNRIPAFAFETLILHSHRPDVNATIELEREEHTAFSLILLLEDDAF